MARFLGCGIKKQVKLVAQINLFNICIGNRRSNRQRKSISFEFHMCLSGMEVAGDRFLGSLQNQKPLVATILDRVGRAVGLFCFEGASSGSEPWVLAGGLRGHAGLFVVCDWSHLNIRCGLLQNSPRLNNLQEIGLTTGSPP
jgi:hypothetical protein